MFSLFFKRLLTVKWQFMIIRSLIVGTDVLQIFGKQQKKPGRFHTVQRNF